ncbi:putative nuclease HARBI1 [Cinnamomum micranthum f. kanehirae]|uniref:Putative nuclease HARBI1 n=1 Tax=Cinnamomum micranthum f. kanehirae TaxID=337451 RepID=A0A443P671_9MAGN|nr:putative nuclease HARBI1 [Cinnamomum micranthum f. kanehirae]
MSSNDINACRREQVKLNMLTVAAVAGWYIDTYLDKKPCRDSALSGAAYVNELLIGHLERFRQVCRKYYLVDAGYGNTPNYIAPYRGVRYHLREFARGSIGPQDAKELFNLRHSSLRNAIERVFGVIKNHFPILKNTSSHSFDTVTDVIIACCTLHNFIHSHSNGTFSLSFLFINALFLEEDIEKGMYTAMKRKYRASSPLM